MAQEMDGEREGMNWLQEEEIIDKTSGLRDTPSFGKTNEKSRLLSKVWSQTGFPQHPQGPRVRIREASSHAHTCLQAINQSDC